MEKCIYCGGKADTISILRQPICIDCVFDNPEYAKLFNENESYAGDNLPDVKSEVKKDEQQSFL